MNTARTVLASALALLLIPAIAFGHNTVKSDVTLRIEPQAGIVSTIGGEFTLLTQTGYTEELWIDETLDLHSDVSITDIRHSIDFRDRLALYCSHGAFDSQSCEYFPPDAMGLAVRDAILDEYQRLGYPGVYAAAIPNQNNTGIEAFTIGFNGDFVRSEINASGAVIHFSGCDGASLADDYIGCRAFLGYSFHPTIGQAKQHITELYQRLRGWNNGSDVSKRVLRDAVASLTSPRISLKENTATSTVVAPAVEATSMPQTSTFGSTMNAWIKFQSDLDQSIPLSSMITTDGSCQVSNLAWVGADKVSFTLTGTWKGEGAVIVQAANAKSSNNQVALDGNAIPTGGGYGTWNARSPNGDNFVWYLKSEMGGDNPAALVSAFRVQPSDIGIHGEMMTDIESGSDSFFVQRSANPTGPFMVVAAWAASGPRQYLFDDPSGRVGDWYEVWEVDTAGLRTRMASEQANVLQPLQGDPPITAAMGDSLVTMMLSIYPTVSLSTTSTMPVLNWAAFIPDETYRSAIQPLVNKHNTEGLVSEAFTLAEVTSTYGSIQNFSKYWSSHGLRFELRCGDANNWRYHNNSQYYYPASDWQPYWYGAQPALDIMPLAYQLDPAGHQKESTTYLTPEMPLLLDGDVDGDSLSDIAEGIMPCSSPAELALMVRKQLLYQQQTAPPNRHLTVYLEARNLIGNSGPNARMLADSIANAVRTYLPVTMLRNDDTLNLSYYIQQGQATTDLATLPTLIMPFGVVTTRTNWVNLNKVQNFGWWQTPAVSVYPFLDGWSCDLVDFDRSEDTYTLPSSPRPLFHDAMLDTLHGPACGVGPMRGTFIRGDFYTALAFHDIILNHGAPSWGEALVGATHRASLEHPEYTFQYRSLIGFGDPAAKIPGMQYSPTTAVGDAGSYQLSLTSPWPNPVRDRGTVRFTVPSMSRVTLSLFDIQGRCVQVLASGQYQPGSYQQSFTMSTRSAGMYFLRLQVGSQTETQKMLVTR